MTIKLYLKKKGEGGKKLFGIIASNRADGIKI
jgi:hypothetical protein